MRLIDADRLNKPIYAEEDNITGYGMSYDEICGYNDGINIAWNKIDQAPTIDAVQVVRCKDCKYGNYDSEPDDAMVCARTNDGYWRHGDDFCSYGRLKEYK